MARTVFGQSFPILFNLDRTYAESLRPEIFPSDDTERYWAAWDTYVTTWRIGPDMLEALPFEYAQAVERLPNAKAKRGTHLDPHQALGNQLLRLYWQGALAWDNTLFQRFLTVAPAEVMTNILEEIGRTLKNAEGTVDQAILDRLVLLWESRIILWKDDAKRHDSEAAVFYWWFASDKFDRTWATKEMLAALDRTGTTSMDYMVLEQFAEQVSALLQGATKQQEQFDSHSQQALGWHLASLSMTAYENPVTSGFFQDFLPLLPPAVLTAMTSVMGEHLAHQSLEEQRKIWNLWVKEYLEKRILGIPVSISSDEADEFANWCIPLSELFPEMVQLLSKMPVQNVWAHKIVEDLLGSPLVEKHPAAACAFILLVLRAEKYPLLHDELVTLFKKLEQLLTGTPAIKEFEQLLYLRGWKR